MHSKRTGAEVKAPILRPTDVKSPLIRKDPLLGKIKGKRRREWQRISWLYNITNSMDMNLSKLCGSEDKASAHNAGNPGLIPG